MALSAGKDPRRRNSEALLCLKAARGSRAAATDRRVDRSARDRPAPHGAACAAWKPPADLFARHVRIPNCGRRISGATSDLDGWRVLRHSLPSRGTLRSESAPLLCGRCRVRDRNCPCCRMARRSCRCPACGESDTLAGRKARGRSACGAQAPVEIHRGSRLGAAGKPSPSFRFVEAGGEGVIDVRSPEQPAGSVQGETGRRRRRSSPCRAGASAARASARRRRNLQRRRAVRGFARNARHAAAASSSAAGKGCSGASRKSAAKSRKPRRAKAPVRLRWVLGDMPI